MLDAYETIELFGLTESADDLPIPCDDTLRDQIVRETFEGLIAGLQGTGLAREIEPLVHGLASVLFRRRNAIETERDRAIEIIQGLIRAADGSEVLETQLEQAQHKAERLGDVLEGLEIMAESAAQCYEVQTGRAFIPSAGGRNSKQAKQSGAIFEARQWIEAHERDQAERNKIAGTPLAIAGAREWGNHAQIWDMLDRIKARFADSFGQDLILYHKGDRKGVDAIAAAWARARGVAQVEFKPNWKAHGKGAGFKAIDQMLDTYRPLGGVAIFGANGIALNLAQKAEAKGIKAMRVTEKPTQDGDAAR